MKVANGLVAEFAGIAGFLGGLMRIDEEVRGGAMV